MDTPDPAPGSFDFVDSYARLRGGEVEIVLSSLVADLGASPTLTIDRLDRESVSGPVEVQGEGAGRVVRARVPRTALTDGIWKVMVSTADESQQTIAGRLLVQGARPVVLLLGSTNPRSVVPKRRRRAPAHAAQSSLAPAQSPQNAKQRVARVGGRVLDAGLSRLDPNRAVRWRSRARTAARRLLR